MTDHFLGVTFAIVTAMSWAAGVLFFQKSSEAMSPFALNFFKNSIALILFMLTFALFAEPLWQTGWGEDAAWLLLSGAIGIGVGDVLFFRSLHLLGASRSAVVETLYTPSVVLTAFVLLDETITVVAAIGGALILAGILIVVTARPAGQANATLPRADLIDGVLTGAVSVVSMSVSIVAVKPIIEAHSVVWGTSVRLLGGLLAMVVALPFAAELRRETWGALKPHRGWRFALPGAFFGTYIALFSWIGGYKYTTATVASLLNQTSTLFIVAGAALFLGEKLTPRRIGAVALAMVGSVLVLFASPQAEESGHAVIESNSVLAGFDSHATEGEIRRAQ
ncbi:MAG: DMT family transporter [Myxococcota bacterium]